MCSGVSGRCAPADVEPQSWWVRYTSIPPVPYRVRRWPLTARSCRRPRRRWMTKFHHGGRLCPHMWAGRFESGATRDSLLGESLTLMCSASTPSTSASATRASAPCRTSALDQLLRSPLRSHVCAQATTADRTKIFGRVN
jgi:hypothetical protein